MDSADLFRVGMHMARSAMHVSVTAAAGKYGIVELEVDSTHNAFLLSATIEVGAGAFFEVYSSTRITEGLAGPHPSSNLNLMSGRDNPVATARSGRATAAPVSDGMLVPGHTEPFNHVFYFPIIIPAGSILGMISKNANEAVSFGLDWIEAPPNVVGRGMLS